jgi:hypothetical protein
MTMKLVTLNLPADLRARLAELDDRSGLLRAVLARGLKKLKAAKTPQKRRSAGYRQPAMGYSNTTMWVPLATWRGMRGLAARQALAGWLEETLRAELDVPYPIFEAAAKRAN